MRRYQTVGAEPIDDGLDRLNPTLLKKRFLQVNHERLQRTRSALNYRQDIFLTALPLLFHCNHPMLPGFVSHSTPVGVSGFKPDKSDLARGRSLARSFRMTGGYQGDDIWGIYLIGSVGSLAQSSESDFDVWLCHKPGLSQAALNELEQKCQRISAWANTLRIEAHFFLMDCDAFRAGKGLSLDAESSGSSQQLLLLDEFYRTALYIAGRLPLWWFVPSNKEPEYLTYAAELNDKRFVRPDSTLDFGGLGHIPDSEFLGAGIWQLYKAITSPHKSVLKLLLIEAYVSEYPNIRPLALDFKQRVYQGEEQINELDPYLLAYRRIEYYLTQKKDSKRLELVRQCVYFKVNKPLSKPPNRLGRSWQRQLLERLTSEWGWSESHLRKLDQHSQWKTLEVQEERRQLVRALNQSYQVLRQFAGTNSGHAISSNELNALGRKLQAAFERRPGKLDWINSGISCDLSESVLSLVQTSDDAQQTVWQVFGDATGAHSPLRQAESPVELLLWCHINGIIDGHILFELNHAPSINESQVRRTLTHLQQWLPLPLTAPLHEHYQHSAIPTRVLMLINVAAEAPSVADNAGAQRLSDTNDAFSYGRSCDNLVASIDIVILNNWQEITCQRLVGPQALLAALQIYMGLCMPGSHQAPPELAIDCPGHFQGALIAQRARQWFQEIGTCYYSGTKPPWTRYLFELSGRFYSLQFKGPKLSAFAHADTDALLQYLEEPQSRYSPIVIDSYALQSHPLKWIAKHSSVKAIYVYFQRRHQQLKAYIVDEQGSIITWKCDHPNGPDALSSLHGFLRSVLQRLEQPHPSGVRPEFGVYPIQFLELKDDELQKFVLTPRVVPPEWEPLDLATLRAKVRYDSQGRFEYSFFYQGQAFTSLQFGQDVFATTARFILNHRQQDKVPSVFLRDLDLELHREHTGSTPGLQLTHYLRVKTELEYKLNSAIRNAHRSRPSVCSNET